MLNAGIKGLPADSSAVVPDVPSAANQTEMEAASSTTKFSTPGTEKFHPGVAKAWANFSLSAGVVTVRASLNVSTITQHASGAYRVTFTSALANAFYVVVPGWSGGYVEGSTVIGYGYTPNVRNRSTTTFDLYLGNPSAGGNTNPAVVNDGEIHFVVYGDFS
jgi:hypothetical protein